MKKILCFYLFVVLLFTSVSCESGTQQIQSPVNFYYKTDSVKYDSQQGVITVEVRDAKSHANDYQYLLEQYLNGPRVGGRISPFPAGTTLKEFNLNASSAQVILSPHLTMLSDSELMIACVCLARTLFDLTYIQTVQIGAQNNLLNGQQYVTITTENFTIWNNSISPMDLQMRPQE